MDIPIITPLFGYVFKFFYGFSHNYLLALFLFAVVMKIILLPFGIKQQKNSIKQAKLRPKEMAIRNKYKGRNDKATQQKMQEEIMKLYQEENFNPMGGCLPMLIQLPILFALYAVIINPLTHIASFDKNAVNNVKSAVTEVNEMLEKTEDETLKKLKSEIGRGDEIGYINAAIKLDGLETKVIVNDEGKILAYEKDDKYFDTKNNEVEITTNPYSEPAESTANDEKDETVEQIDAEEVVVADETTVNEPATADETVVAEETVVADTGVSDESKEPEAVDENATTEPAEAQNNAVNVDGVVVREVTVSDIFHEKLTAKKFDSKKTLETIYDIKKSFTIFGLDLTRNGEINLSIYVLIPLLTFIFSFFSTKVIRKFTYQPTMTANADPSQKASMGMMDWMMPLLSVWISLSISSAIAIYWMFQNVLSAIQQIVLFKLYPIPPVTEEMIKEAELQLKGKNKQNKQPVLSDDYFDDYDKTIKDEPSSNKKKKKGVISSRKMNKLNPKVIKIYKQGRHLTAKKKI